MEPLPGQLGFELDDLAPAADRPAATMSGGYWRGFSADHPLADALASFRQRFGRDPEQVLQDRGNLLLGPL